MFILRDFRHRQNIVLAQLVSATGAAIFHELMDRQNKEPKLQNAKLVEQGKCYTCDENLSE